MHLVSASAFRTFVHRDAKITKLATNEDPHHIHKTLGAIALASFAYRYGWVYPAKGTLGFDGPTAPAHNQFVDWATMLVHTALAFSASSSGCQNDASQTNP